MSDRPRYKLGASPGSTRLRVSPKSEAGNRATSHALTGQRGRSRGAAAGADVTSAVDLAIGTPDVAIGAARPRRAWWSSVVLADALALGASFAVGTLARQPLGRAEGPPVGVSLALELPFLPFYLAAMAAYGLYRRDRRRLRSQSFLDIGPRGHALALGAVLAMGISAGLHRFTGFHKIGWVEATFMSLPATVFVPLARSALRFASRKRPEARSRALILGSGMVAGSLARRLSRCDEVELVGFVDDNPHPAEGGGLPPYRGELADLARTCRLYDVDRVLVAFTQSSPKGIAEALRCLPAGVRVSVVPRLFELVTWQSQVEELHGLTVMDIAPPNLDIVSRTLKRTMDLAVSCVALVLLSPLMLAIAAAVKATSSGPVLFRQDRVGYRGKTFQILKFRTMEDGADRAKIDLRDHNQVDGPLFKIHNDPRVTAVGRFLRTTSLDELPQLFNVLRGDMSLVGPRPFVPDESAGIEGWAKRRFEVRPGMTGLWQVSGRNDLPFEELRQLDYAYVASWSLWWDLKILWHTPGSVLRRHGAY
jgi:exopolysaccharide biosynthesis polyprenyl glycosylphosphotransferase